jgi:hypothetical protein
MQWIIGIIIDFTIYLGFSEILGFKAGMTFVLITSFFSYLFFLLKNFFK